MLYTFNTCTATQTQLLRDFTFIVDRTEKKPGFWRLLPSEGLQSRACQINNKFHTCTRAGICISSCLLVLRDRIPFVLLRGKWITFPQKKSHRKLQEVGISFSTLLLPPASHKHLSHYTSHKTYSFLAIDGGSLEPNCLCCVCKPQNTIASQFKPRTSRRYCSAGNTINH